MEFDENKLFVGGLLSATSDEELKRHFSKYGVVVNAVVARDKLTRISRGFGFVLFSEQSSADKALEESQVILGRRVEVKRAKARREQHHLQQQQQQHHESSEQNNGALGWSNGNGNSNGNGSGESGDNIIKFRTKKVFVGGLAANVAEKDFLDYFGRFGRITDVVVMYDSVTNRPRGFGFVTFESEESAERALHKSFHELNGRHVEVKRAVPRENFSNNSNTTTAGAGMTTFQPVDYTSNSPGYGGFPWFTPHTVYNADGRFYYGPGVYGYEYPVGYPTNNLFMAPFPRATFYSPLIIGGSTYPMHHVGSPAYSVFGNIGTAVMGAMVGGYNEILPSVSEAKYNASQTEGLRLDMERLNLKKNVAAGALLSRVRDNN